MKYLNASQAPLIGAVLKELKLEKILIKKETILSGPNSIICTTLDTGDLEIRLEPDTVNIETSDLSDLTRAIEAWVMDYNPDSLTIEGVINQVFCTREASYGARSRVGKALARLGWERAVKRGGVPRQFVYRKVR